MTLGIASVDGPRLARALFAAADWVAAGRDEINRINVFPVLDGDTGTNFSLTLRAVADALRVLGDATLPETADGMACGAVLGARGTALARTPDQMATLKEAGVVDAGGKGFVRMLEGVVRSFDRDPIPTAVEANGVGASTVVVPAARAAVAADPSVARSSSP